MNPSTLYITSVKVGAYIYHLGTASATSVNSVDTIIAVTSLTSANILSSTSIANTYTGTSGTASPYSGYCLSITAVGSKLILGCQTRLVTLSINSDGSVSSSSAVSYIVGTGAFHSLYYHASMGLIYAGTSNGFSFAIDASTFRIRKLAYLTVQSGNPITSIWVDEDSAGIFPREPVIFWGNQAGVVFRTNANATSLTIIANATIPSLSGHALAAPQILGLESDYIYIPAPSVGTGGADSSSFAIYKSKKVNCAAYSCSSCMADPYCGWCYSTQTCAQPSTCPSAEYSPVTGTCPSLQYISPSSGSVTGGTNVVVYGAFYRVNSTYNCLWTITPSGGQASGYQSPALSVTSTSLICVSPAAPTGSSHTTTLTINYIDSTGASVQWMNAATGYTYYNCSSLSCSQCTATSSSSASTVNAIYKECGWCVMSAACTTQAKCATPNSTLALANTSLAWSTSATPCPATTSVTPSSISVTSTNALTLRVSNFPATSATTGAFNCRFSLANDSSVVLTSSATGVTNTSRPSLFSTFRCPIPTTTQATFGSTSDVIVSISTATSSSAASANTVVTTGSGSALNIYSCTDFTRCDQCASTTHPECVWCASSRTCNYNTSTTCTAATSCPTLSAISPNSSQVYAAQNLPIALTGTQLSATTGVSCMFVSRASAVSLTTTATINSATSVSCNTPTDAGFSVGLWDVSLAANAVSLMDSRQFSIYNCAALNSCQTCVSDTTPGCYWCSEPGRVTCTNSTSSTCARRIGAAQGNASCPIITEVDPTYVVVSKPYSVDVSGSDFDLTAASVNELLCALSLDNETTITTTEATFIDASTVSCDSVTITTTGTADLFLMDNSTRYAFSTLSSLDVQTCSDITNCTQCISFGCVLCWGQCTDSCSDASGLQTVCPVVTSVSPTFSDINNPVTIKISGENFIAYTESSTKRDAFQSYGENVLAIVADLQAQAAPGVALSLPEIDAVTSTKRESEATAAIAGYQCYFGSQVTSGTWQSSTLVECPSPSGGVNRDVEMVVYVNGGPYFTAQTGYNLFECTNSVQTETCYDGCTATAHCGWCASTLSCSSQTVCQAPSIWQETCNVPTLSQNVSGITGGDTLYVNMSTALPAYTTKSDILCAFGEATATISAFYPNTTGSEITAVECEIPPSPDVSGASVSFSVTYQADRVTTTSTFVYVECAQYKSCTKCSVQTGCGWCRTNNKCTMESACSAAKWTKTNCPVSALALGLGIGLGLLFVIVVAGLIVFLVWRGNRKRGLLIRMVEPNYDAIAWGADSDLQFRVPSHKYGVLERALCRKDHLLQLALSLTCPATEQEMLAKGLVFVAVYHNFAPEMIQTVIRAEVASCLDENTLFRSNSVASKMYKFYSRIVGIKYLYHCIARMIMELEVLGQKSMIAAEAPAEKKGDGSNSVSILQVTMELDTDVDVVADGNIDTDTNLLQLQLICQKILSVLTKKALKDIPAPLRRIFVEIDRTVSTKFPGSIDAVYKGLGGLYFLRFVCPAITAPHVYGLLERAPNGATQRQLVLIGKVIQSIANMSPPGRKEPYMEVMGGFINQSIPRIKEFYDNLRQAANVETGALTYDREIVVPEEVLLNGLAATQVVLAREAEKIKVWSKTSYLDEESQKDLCVIIDECMEEDNTAPKKAKKENGAASSKKKK